MRLRKLGSCLFTALHLTNKNVFYSRVSSHLTPAAHLRYKSEKYTLRKDDDDNDDTDKPIKFSNSGAAKWDPVYSRTGEEFDDWPWYQPYVIVASVATFLIYFCVLREENDIDERLTLQLSDHFEGEQKKRLEASQNLPNELLKREKIV